MSDYGCESDLQGKRKNEAGEPITEELEARIMRSDLPAQIKNSAQRGLYLGQRFLKEYIENIKNTAVLTGFKPTSRDENSGLHIGHKFIIDTLVALQQSGSQVYIPIADEEAKLTGGYELEKSKRIAAQYLLDMGALGLNLDYAYIYLQSEELIIKDVAKKLKEFSNFGDVSKHYVPESLTHLEILSSDKALEKISYIIAGFNQAGDIYLPQILTGSKYVLIPCGPDQEVHLDFAIKYVKFVDKEFKEPVPLYAGHIGSLKYAGKKMSSSKDGEYAVFLVDDPKNIQKLILGLEIVPREIAKKLQLKLNGKFNQSELASLETLIEQHQGKVINIMTPEICPIIDLLKYHFTNDRVKLATMLAKSPEEQKEYVANAMQQLLTEHQKRRAEVLAYAQGKASVPAFWKRGGKAPQVNKRNRTTYKQIILSAFLSVIQNI